MRQFTGHVSGASPRLERIETNAIVPLDVDLEVMRDAVAIEDGVQAHALDLDRMSGRAISPGQCFVERRPDRMVVVCPERLRSGTLADSHVQYGETLGIDRALESNTDQVSQERIRFDGNDAISLMKVKRGVVAVVRADVDDEIAGHYGRAKTRGLVEA